MLLSSQYLFGYKHVVLDVVVTMRRWNSWRKRELLIKRKSKEVCSARIPPEVVCSARISPLGFAAPLVGGLISGGQWS